MVCTSTLGAADGGAPGALAGQREARIRPFTRGAAGSSAATGRCQIPRAAAGHVDIHGHLIDPERWRSCLRRRRWRRTRPSDDPGLRHLIGIRLSAGAIFRDRRRPYRRSDWRGHRGRPRRRKRCQRLQLIAIISIAQHAVRTSPAKSRIAAPTGPSSRRWWLEISYSDSAPHIRRPSAVSPLQRHRLPFPQSSAPRMARRKIAGEAAP